MPPKLSFELVFGFLLEDRSWHVPGSAGYELCAAAAREVVMQSALTKSDEDPVSFFPFGDIVFPYRNMGAIDSLDLFGIDELILFAFYHSGRSRYRRALDIGANIGLHSIVMSRCGFSVEAYEPDPKHFEILSGNLKRNTAAKVKPVEAAVSDHEGRAEFVRVLGNTTSSHLAGAKANPYGELDRFPVRLVNFGEIISGADFVKIDAEGHEVKILLAAPRDSWKSCDAMLEVGTPENARQIFDAFGESGVNMFAQKTGWGRVTSLADLPSSHREGSLFLTSRSGMEW